jgi:hypothetical protein
MTQKAQRPNCPEPEQREDVFKDQYPPTALWAVATTVGLWLHLCGRCVEEEAESALGGFRPSALI